MTDLRELLHAVADDGATGRPPVVDWLTPVRAARRRRRQRRALVCAVGGLAAVGLAATTLTAAFHPTRQDAVVASVPDPVRSAEASVVKVTGIAPSCSKRAQETGFIVAPHRVMTTAHVLSGVTEDVRIATRDGRTTSAVVVLYDETRDIAVLRVDDLSGAPFALDDNAAVGGAAYLVGYPEDGAVRTRESTITARRNVTGPDIYQEGQVTRDIYSLRGALDPGEAGGPVVSKNGELVGMSFARAVDAPDTTYALTSSQIDSAIQAGLAASEPVSTRSCIAHASSTFTPRTTSPASARSD
jgi:S1-C subfamily serine protease